MKRVWAVFLLLILFTGLAGGQEIRRPTTDVNNSGADCPGIPTVNNTTLPNAYDASGAATSSTFTVIGLTNSSEVAEGRTFTTWSAASGPYSSLSVGFNITFTDNGQGLTDVTKVEYSTDSGSTWTVFSGTSATLSPSQSLSALQVRFCASVIGSAGGTAGRSTVAAFDVFTSGVLNPPPAAPTSLAATPAANGLSVAITWTDNATNETNYQVNRCDGGTCSPTNGAPPDNAIAIVTSLPANSVSFTDTSTVASHTYGYQAFAVNSAGTTGSNVVYVTTPSLPAAPTGIALSFSNTTITISWNDNATNETNYVLQRCIGLSCTPADYQTLGANTTSFNDTSIPGKGIFTYNVLASNAVGRSSGTGNATVITGKHQPGAGNAHVSQ